MGKDERAIWRKLIEKEAFRESFVSIELKDAEQATEIKGELLEVLDRTQQFYRCEVEAEELSAESTGRMKLWEKRSGILQEMLNLKAHMKRYTDSVAEFVSKETELRQQAPAGINAFFDSCSNGLDQYFDDKQRLLHQNIDSEVTWTTETKDMGTKLLRGTIGVGETTARLLGGKLKGFDVDLVKKGRDAVKEMEVKAHLAYGKINPENTFTQIWTRHMDHEAMDVERILTEAWKHYDRYWEHLPAYANVCNDEGFFPCVSDSVNGLVPEGVTSPAMKSVKNGSSVAGFATVSLAMGWHTLSYAMIHVFPPAMLFSFIAAAMIGITQEHGYKTQVKDQFSRCLRLTRQDYVQLWFEGIDPKKHAQIPLRTAIMVDAGKRVDMAMHSWQLRLFGNLELNDYKDLIGGFELHLSLLEEALELLDEKMTILSQERSEYAQFVKSFRLRYPDLDQESAGMLATGEVLLKIYEELKLSEFSSMALPFTKVIERELYRVFGAQFEFQVKTRQSDGRYDKFMLGTFLKMVDRKEIQRQWSEEFRRNLDSANNVRRSIAHRDPVSYKRAMEVRELTIGLKNNLLDEIRSMA